MRERVQAKLSTTATNATSKDDELVAMISAYQHSGGTLRADELGELLKARDGTDPASLQDWLTGGQVFGFEWRGAIWFPMFQFDPLDLRPRRGLHLVLGELDLVLSGWARARWFVRPNLRLRYRMPVDVVCVDLDSVVTAAREDRLDIVASESAACSQARLPLGSGA